MYSKKTKGNNDSIVGICPLNNHPCFVLFDCGTSHSFISTQCVEHLELGVIPLSILMVVTTSMDNVVETQWMCGNCSLSLNGRVFQIDLICLPFKKIYVVLGMD